MESFEEYLDSFGNSLTTREIFLMGEAFYFQQQIITAKDKNIAELQNKLNLAMEFSEKDESDQVYLNEKITSLTQKLNKLTECDHFINNQNCIDGGDIMKCGGCKNKQLIGDI